jgi:hypothetical protein
MQTAIDAGNMVRKRLFNKYQKLVRCVYTRFLQLVQKHWNTKRKIMATDQEGALAVAYYEGADLSGGFDLEVDYGASFSLEPSRRREEIMQIMPMLKEAGFSMRMILGMMRFNDMPGLMDRADMSGRRQLEIFDEMIAKYEEGGVLAYVAPEELEDHQNMLPVAYDFRQSMAYKTLDAELKPLIEKHIKDREALAAQAAAAGAQPGPDAAPPPGGLPGGALAGMLPSI